MWPDAVRLCILCPVRGQCLDDALAHQDTAVIRGGQWLSWSKKRGHTATPLTCAHCHRRPVQHTHQGNPTLYCGHGCRAAAKATRLAHL